MKIQTQSKGSLEKYFTSEEIFIPRDLQMICKQNKAKWFAKQLASLVYQCKAKVLEFPSKKTDTLRETIPQKILSPRPNLT